MHKSLSAQTTGRLYGLIAGSVTLALTVKQLPDAAGFFDLMAAFTLSLLTVCGSIVGIYTAVVCSGLLLNVATRNSAFFHRHIEVVPEMKYPAVNALTLLKALAAEVAANIRSFWYLFAWKNRADVVEGNELASQHRSNLTPVLLVHGFMCNAGVWHDLRGHLKRRGITSHSICCDPLGGDIDDFAHVLREGVEELKRRTGARQVRMIGHSMGGLIIRAYVKHYGHDSIESAMCLGAPHQGTLYALGGQGVCAKQMHIGNRWLMEMTQSQRDIEFRSKLVNVCTTLEDIVQPASSAALPGARNWMVSHCGHTVMPADKGVLSLIDHWLDEQAQTRQSEHRSEQLAA
jgi:pimeloyl-ACP methyl ester carboxylesterase